MGGVGIIGVIVIASTALALRPVDFDASATELHAPARRDLPESFRSLPTEYEARGPVSRLGPPLPKDLGAALADTSPPTGGYENPFRFDPVMRPKRQPALAHPGSKQPSMRQQRIAEARSSDIFFVNRRGDGESVDASVLDSGFASEADILALQQQTLAVGQGHVIQAGSLIPATLVTGLNSDLPGHVIAQVSEPVFDSVTGRELLVPQGSRLIGRYDSDTRYGQSRAFVSWSRLIRPDGSSTDLGAMGAVDEQGFAGLSDQVDRHTGKLFQAALLSSVLSIGTELGRSDEDRLLDAIADGNQRTIGRAGEAIVSRQLDVKPTITIRPGSRLKVLVATDLTLPTYGEQP